MMSTFYPIVNPLWTVVRRPELAFDVEAHHPLKVVDSLLYQGLDRLEWWDISELYWTRQLRADLVPLYKELQDCKAPGTLEGANQATDALALLRASPEVEAKNEVVCVVGAEHRVEGQDLGVKWLGYDPIYKSGTSYTLLVEAFLGDNELAAQTYPRLNQFGLFDTAEPAREFIHQYRVLADDELVEPLPLFDESVEVLAVGRLLEGEQAVSGYE